MQEKEFFIHLFRTLNSYYLYDVNLNSIIKINEITYNKLKNKQEILGEDLQISKLKQRGFLQPIDRNINIEHPLTDMIMKDDEKGKEQNAQGLYENRVINEISVNSQEVFYQDAYDRCVKEVSYNTQNKMYNIMHKRMRLYIIIQQKRPETGFFC